MGTLSAAAFIATWLTVIVAVAGALVALGVGYGVVSFFHERRADRIAHHESIRTYYRHHAFAH
jgi:membrane protein DedA with SNARE-associated domain